VFIRLQAAVELVT